MHQIVALCRGRLCTGTTAPEVDLVNPLNILFEGEDLRTWKQELAYSAFVSLGVCILGLLLSTAAISSLRSLVLILIEFVAIGLFAFMAWQFTPKRCRHRAQLRTCKSINQF
jgi:hypothetical protein